MVQKSLGNGGYMKLSEDRLQAIEVLVNELLKSSPEESKVQGFLKKAGIEDPKDPVARIESVLEALQYQQPEKDFKE